MPLGRGDKPRAPKRFRRKATPDGYPGEGPVSIDQAYRELTHPAFSVWMRLMVASERELASGRRAMSRMLNYSVAQCNRVFSELRRKGYIAWIRTPGEPSICVILRRAKIRGKTNFVRISSLLKQESGHVLPEQNAVLPEQNDLFCRGQND